MDNDFDPVFTRAVINLEGIDGIGKATIADALSREFSRRHYFSTVHSYPRYHTITGGMVKRLLEGEFGDPIKIDPKLASLPYITDRHHDYATSLTAIDYGDSLWHGGNYIGLRYVFDRSWGSNFFFQGTKVYFKDVFEAINSEFRPCPFLGSFESLDDLEDELEKMRKEIKDRPGEWNTPFMGKCVALIERKCVSQACGASVYPAHVVIGHVFRSASEWRPWGNGDSLEVSRPHDLLKFANWLYDLEINATKLKDVPQYTFVLTRDGASRDIVNRVSSKLVNRAKLDMYETARYYQLLVQIFSEWLMNDKIFVQDQTTCKTFRNAFKPMKKFHTIMVKNVEGDPNDPDIKEKIVEVSQNCAIRIADMMEGFIKVPRSE